MTDGKTILDTVMRQTTGFPYPRTIKEGFERYAYDISLPVPVKDTFNGARAWAQAPISGRFVDMQNALDFDENFWMRPTVQPTSLNELLELWKDINIITASRQIDSIDVFESDNIYTSENIVRSVDVTSSKNILWCDRVEDCEYMVASQRSRNCSYGLRVEDSRNCSESISVSWSGNVVKSAFIHDCADVVECLFCARLRGKRYCIANMQFDEATYFMIKKKVMKWIVGTA